jgi:hypothetical protein
VVEEYTFDFPFNPDNIIRKGKGDESDELLYYEENDENAVNLE